MTVSVKTSAVEDPQVLSYIADTAPRSVTGDDAAVKFLADRAALQTVAVIISVAGLVSSGYVLLFLHDRNLADPFTATLLGAIAAVIVIHVRRMFRVAFLRSVAMTDIARNFNRYDGDLV